MKKIRVFEAFAGYGSQAMAAKRLQRDFPGQVEFEFVGTSEIEPAEYAAEKVRELLLSLRKDAGNE